MPRSQELAETTQGRFRLSSSYKSQFYQSLQLIRCFDAFPGHPREAAQLSLLFQYLDLQTSLINLRGYLTRYVQPYIASAPHSQSDQSAKVLAAASYIFITDRNGLQYDLPEKQIIDYVEYAAGQSWFGDPFIAYYCSHLDESVAACHNARSFLERNFEQYLERRNVPAIAQTMIALGGTLPEQEQEKGYNQLCEFSADDRLSIRHAAWALAALATASPSQVDPKCRHRLVDYLEQELTEYSTQLVHQSGIPGILALIWGANDLEDIPQFLSHSLGGDASQTFTADLVESEQLQIKIHLANLRERASLPSLADITLVLTGLVLAGEHRFVGVRESQGEQLQAALVLADRLEDTDALVISKLQNAVLGAFVFVTVSVVGVAVSLFFLGAKFNLDFSTADWREPGTLTTAVATLVYLLLIAWSMYTGRSIGAAVLLLPLIERLGHWGERASQMTDQFRRGRDHAD